MAGKFEIKRATDGQFYFNLKARNGEIILTSEMYTTKANIYNGITAVMTNALLDQRFERKTSKRREPYFILKAAHGEPLALAKCIPPRPLWNMGLSPSNNTPQTRG
jgi:uncharacterized protein YegP (UPF0339 family)